MSIQNLKKIASEIKIARSVNRALNQPKRKSKTRNVIITSGKRRPRKQPMAGDASVRDLACSVTDPFNCSACIPDGNTNTGCYSVKQMYTLGTGAGGSVCGLLVQPDVDSFSMQDNAGLTNVTTIPATWASASAAATISSQFAVSRPVSAGIRVEYIGNTQTDQGLIVVGQATTNTTPLLLNGQGLTGLTNLLSSFKTFPLRAGAVITWRPEDYEDQEQFTSVNGTGGAGRGTATARPYLVVYIYGANTNTASLVQCEVTVNFEGQFKLMNFVPGGISAGKKSTVPAVPGWFEKAKNIYNMVEPYIPLVLSMFGGPGRAAALAMGNGMAYRTQIGQSSMSL